MLRQGSCTELGNVAHMVVGAGALGLFLAWDLSSAHGEISVVNRRPLSLPVRVRAQGSEQTFHPKFSWELESSLVRFFSHPEADALVLFLCVPPQAVEPVSAVLAEILRQRARAPGVLPALTIVFCSNGLLSAHTQQNLQSAWPVSRLSLVRALFFVGCERDEGAETTVVHNGGSLVRYGWLQKGHHPTGLHVPFPPVAGRLLCWREVHDISALEAHKFFVNLCLAGYIGSRMLPNGKLAECASPADFVAMSQFFARLFQDRQVNSDDSLLLLWETVAATAANVNSVSKAWNQGNPLPWESLTHGVRQLLGSADADCAVFFEEFFEAANSRGKSREN